MSSISAQGVVERASAELSKRINGLGLRKHHHGGKTSVMERVTNALCGSSASANNNSNQFSEGQLSANSEKHQRVPVSSAQQNSQKHSTTISLQTSHCSVGPTQPVNSGVLQSNIHEPNTVMLDSISQNKNASSTNVLIINKSISSATKMKKGYPLVIQSNTLSNQHQILQAQPQITTFEQLLLDERFLNKFFQYFVSYDCRILAQVCTKWRDTLYRSPRYWSGLLPILQCRELKQMNGQDRVKLYSSLIRRGFHSIGLVGAFDEDVLDIAHSFPLASKQIHSLSLRCSSVSDRGLETLLDHLQSLFELELAGCNEITEAGLWACLTPRIVSLSLADCINIADEAVGAVAQLLPSLYEFSLQAYHVTDAALGYFSPKQSHSLSILRLQSCWELTNHGVVNIVHSLPHLTVLSLSGCSKITDDGVELIAENLQKLRALDLSWCPRITDASLEYIACDLNQLEELTLDRCVHITDIGVGYISTMLSLTTLFLRWCSQVRDFGLQHLCSMRNLQILSLAGCPLLTSSGLSSLIQLRHLQELELTNCPGASLELFEYLKEHLPRCLIIE
ncbi:F-box/LRR-repeat protein 16 isoform X2 [Condylostylus longicornis]|uniref:F-box/LRR-repeat protein 16 isoform X2 n=1 Tax=Condylostylus longicornis TaxID=2530218 RepID=UPI00244E1DF2|nr:F-box/LRR-repeat protein 16 isoform X2 [Condylostylus longicornis]